MKCILFAVVVGLALLGCDKQKHVISVNRLLKCQEINVLYVSYAEPYQLATKNGTSSITRLVRGGAYYKLDLCNAKVDKDKAKSDDAIKVTLPKLIIEPQPDPFRSVEFNPKTKLFVNDSGLNRIREMYDAMDREKIIAGTSTPEYLEMAKEQAEEIVRKMLPELKVEIEWVE